MSMGYQTALNSIHTPAHFLSTSSIFGLKSDQAILDNDVILISKWDFLL